jgi:hypothetical protein
MAGPIEAIVPSTIVDIFFLHDRGEKISLYGLSALGGNEIGPVLSAYIIEGAGMSWYVSCLTDLLRVLTRDRAFYFVAIASFGSFLSVFFLMPETAFYGFRASTHREGTVLTQPAQEVVSDSASETKSPESDTAIQCSSDTEAATDVVPKLTYLQTLKPWSVINPHLPLKKAFLRPFVLLA